jgi:hypothetical protein
MPPCGYNVEGVEAFALARRCTFQELKREVASGKHATLTAGAEFEVRQIRTVMEAGIHDDQRYGVLLLTLSDYEKFLDRRLASPSESEDASFDYVLREGSISLLSLHITENPTKLVDRPV